MDKANNDTRGRAKRLATQKADIWRAYRSGYASIYPDLTPYSLLVLSPKIVQLFRAYACTLQVL